MSLKLLSDDALARIHEATLDVLEHNGVWFTDSPAAHEVFRRHGCTVDGNRVRIPRQLFADSLKTLPDRNQLQLCVVKLGMSELLGLGPGESHVGLIGNPYYLYDYAAGERGLRDADDDDKFLVMDCLPNLKYDCCCVISEAQRSAHATFPDYQDAAVCADYLRRRVRSRPRERVKPLAIHSNIMHGREANSVVHSPRVYKPMEKMELLRHAIVAGPAATAALLAQDTPLIWCNPVSPLQYHPDQVRAIMQGIRDFGRKVFIMFSPEVMLGATGPVTLEAALVQHNAEVMSGVLFTQLCAPGTAAIYGSVSGVMDLRVGEIALGNFESIAFNVGVTQLAHFYGLPSRIQSGNTNARRPGVRAAVETAWGLQMMMAAGANLVHTGLLDATLMLSLEHLVLVDELVSQVRSGLQLGRTDAAHLALDVIRQEGHPDTNYISHDHTMEHMKEVVHYSDYTGRAPRSQEDWYALAHAKVAAILQREHPAEDDRAVAARLQAVQARLQEDDQTWRRGGDDWWRGYVRDL